MSELSVGLMRREEQGVTPWRNGAGVTRELAACVLDGELEWRVSIARIDVPGAFSTWPGMHRTLTVLTGDQIVLAVGGHEHAVQRGHTFGFSGDADVSGTLPGGPVEVLNVMTRRGRTRLVTHTHELRHGPVHVGADDLAVLVEGVAAARLVDGAESLPMGTLDVLLPVAGTARLVTGVGELIVIHRC